eukprot:1704351-Amphidinium_carterae.1
MLSNHERPIVFRYGIKASTYRPTFPSILDCLASHVHYEGRRNETKLRGKANEQPFTCYYANCFRCEPFHCYICLRLKQVCPDTATLPCTSRND